MSIGAVVKTKYVALVAPIGHIYDGLEGLNPQGHPTSGLLLRTSDAAIPAVEFDALPDATTLKEWYCNNKSRLEEELANDLTSPHRGDAVWISYVEFYLYEKDSLPATGIFRTSADSRLKGEAVPTPAAHYRVDRHFAWSFADELTSFNLTDRS